MQTHRCRFVEYNHPGINVLAFTPESLLHPNATNPGASKQKNAKRRRGGGVGCCYLACARENGDIELWNAKDRWFLERTIPGRPDSSIESVVWIHERGEHLNDADDDEEEQQHNSNEKTYNNHPRLFSAGLDGMIREWDLVMLREKCVVESNGGAIWCMAANPKGTHLAIGCEDGSSRLFKILSPSRRFAVSSSSTDNLSTASQNGNKLTPFSEGHGDADALGFPTLEFVRNLDKHQGRILCIDWHPSGDYIVTGSSDGNIRKIDVRTGRCVQRITGDTRKIIRHTKQRRRKRHNDMSDEDEEESPDTSDDHSDADDDDDDREANLVWCLKVLRDGTIVSGDSFGNVNFWDWRTGTLVYGVRVHKADVLCITADKSGRTVYTSGIDRVIVQLRQIETSKSHKKRWIISGERRFHSHDVRSLALFEGKPVDALVSGGVDTTLVISSPASSFPQVKQFRATPYPFQPNRPIIHLAKEARLIMAKFSDGVKVWKLGEALPTPTPTAYLPDNERLDFKHKEKLLIDLKPKIDTNLMSAAISSDGKWIVMSDMGSIKLFKVTYPDPSQKTSKHNTLKVVKCRNFPPAPAPASSIGGGAETDLVSLPPGAHALCFTPDSRRLIVAGIDSVVYIVDLATPEFKILKAFYLHCGQSSSTASVSARLNEIDEEDEEDDDVDAMDTDVVEAAASKKGKKKAAKTAVTPNRRMKGVGVKEIVCSLAVSADGAWLASGDLANRIYVYNLDALK
ncbi:U3 small nucleolar RNA-associated protein 4, partial [Quaeritorhiza haematococci]